MSEHTPARSSGAVLPKSINLRLFDPSGINPEFRLDIAFPDASRGDIEVFKALVPPHTPLTAALRPKVEIPYRSAPPHGRAPAIFGAEWYVEALRSDLETLTALATLSANVLIGHVEFSMTTLLDDLAHDAKVCVLRHANGETEDVCCGVVVQPFNAHVRSWLAGAGISFDDDIESRSRTPGRTLELQRLWPIVRFGRPYAGGRVLTRIADSELEQTCAVEALNAAILVLEALAVNLPEPKKALELRAHLHEELTRRQRLLEVLRADTERRRQDAVQSQMQRALDVTQDLRLTKSLAMGYPSVGAMYGAVAGFITKRVVDSIIEPLVKDGTITESKRPQVFWSNVEDLADESCHNAESPRLAALCVLEQLLPLLRDTICEPLGLSKSFAFGIDHTLHPMAGERVIVLEDIWISKLFVAPLEPVNEIFVIRFGEKGGV